MENNLFSFSDRISETNGQRIDADHYHYFTHDGYWWNLWYGGTSGVAWVGTVCSSQPYDRSAISEWVGDGYSRYNAVQCALVSYV